MSDAQLCFKKTEDMLKIRDFWHPEKQFVFLGNKSRRVQDLPNKNNKLKWQT